MMENVGNGTPISWSDVFATAPAVFTALQNHRGIFRGNLLLNWLEGMVQEKTRIAHCTFKELHDLRESNNFKDLHVVVHDLSTKENLLINWTNFPDAVISDTVRISLSLPFLLMTHPLFVKVGGRREEAADFVTHTLIDGGMMENFPIKMFDTTFVPSATRGFYLLSQTDYANAQGEF